MAGFDDFCADLVHKDKLDDAVFVEFLSALSPVDAARIAALATRSGYYDASKSDVLRFFQLLEEAGMPAIDFGKAIIERRVHGKAGVPTPAPKSLRERVRRLSKSAVLYLIYFAIYLGIPLILYGVVEAVRTIHLGILARFAGTAFAITAVIALLLWGLATALTAGGNAIDRTHEWRIVLPGGRPGGRVRAATQKDLYEHRHGHGSWGRRKKRIDSTCLVLAGVAVVVSPLLQLRLLWKAGVGGVVPMIGYFVMYPMLPMVLVTGLAYWLRKYMVLDLGSSTRRR